MGNSSSSSGRGHHDETVDYGSLAPQGVYTGQRDWNQAVVSQLICARRLAPFYRPLEEYDDSWDDDQILAARKELPTTETDNETITRIEAPLQSQVPSKVTHNKRTSTLKEPSKPEAAVYRGAVECPICFLYYPPNINHSRCCDQAICTECFVQIKRNEPTTTHLVSEPAACPYCVQDNFGVVYTPPPWRTGMGCENSSFWAEPSRSPLQAVETSSYPTHKRRQKSFGADSPEVVTTDQIRPDWEAKLAAVRAAVTRRANRRIIMRQVGDRLIPVGVTSGRVHALSPEEAQAEGVETGGSRRSRRRQQANQNQNFEQFMGMGGQDLEELMVMEAMRLSMIDHEEHQRKEAEEQKKREAEAAQLEADTSIGPTSNTGPASSNWEGSMTNPTSLSSSPSGSTPASSPSVSLSQVQPSDSINSIKRNSFLSSFTRSRTPPPNASSNSLRSGESMPSSWHRTPSPAPFSTLSAAMSAASTAAAIFEGGAVTSGESAFRSSPVNADAESGAIFKDVTSRTVQAHDETESLQPSGTRDRTSIDAHPTSSA